MALIAVLLCRGRKKLFPAMKAGSNEGIEAHHESGFSSVVAEIQHKIRAKEHI